MFKPEISIAPSQIHVGRNSFLLHYPGDLTERYGLIGDVGIKWVTEKYVEILRTRFKYEYRVSDVAVPTDQEIEDAGGKDGKVTNLAKSKAPGFVPFWRQLDERLSRNGTLTVKGAMQDLGCSYPTINSAARSHPDLFVLKRGVISRPTGDDIRALVQPQAKTEPAHVPVSLPASEPVRAVTTPKFEDPVKQLVSQSSATSWERALLDKFPAFDPAWTEAVKVEWLRAFETFLKF